MEKTRHSIEFGVSGISVPFSRLYLNSCDSTIPTWARGHWVLSCRLSSQMGIKIIFTFGRLLKPIVNMEGKNNIYIALCRTSYNSQQVSSSCDTQ